MAAILIRGLSDETRQALKLRASENGRSVNAEIRATLDESVKSKQKLRLGSWLHERAMKFGGVELDVLREKNRAPFVDFSGPEFDPPGYDGSEEE